MLLPSRLRKTNLSGKIGPWGTASLGDWRPGAMEADGTRVLAPSERKGGPGKENKPRKYDLRRSKSLLLREREGQRGEGCLRSSQQRTSGVHSKRRTARSAAWLRYMESQGERPATGRVQSRNRYHTACELRTPQVQCRIKQSILGSVLSSIPTASDRHVENSPRRQRNRQHGAGSTPTRSTRRIWRPSNCGETA